MCSLKYIALVLLVGCTPVEVKYFHVGVPQGMGALISVKQHVWEKPQDFVVYNIDGTQRFEALNASSDSILSTLLGPAGGLAKGIVPTIPIIP